MHYLLKLAAWSCEHQSYEVHLAFRHIYTWQYTFTLDKTHRLGLHVSGRRRCECACERVAHVRVLWLTCVCHFLFFSYKWLISRFIGSMKWDSTSSNSGLPHSWPKWAAGEAGGFKVSKPVDGHVDMKSGVWGVQVGLLYGKKEGELYAFMKHERYWRGMSAHGTECVCISNSMRARTTCAMTMSSITSSLLWIAVYTCKDTFIEHQHMHIHHWHRSNVRTFLGNYFFHQIFFSHMQLIH